MAFFGTADRADRTTNNAAVTARARAERARLNSRGNSGTLRTPSSNTGGYGAPVSIKPPSEKDLLAGDSTYAQQTADVKDALSRFLTNQATEKGDYTMDYNTGLRNLGWNQGTNSWDVEDRYQGYGKATNDTRGNFAARGKLQGTDYAGATRDLNRSFNDKKTEFDTALQRFNTGQASSRAEQEAAAKSAQLAARAGAVARRSQGLSSLI